MSNLTMFRPIQSCPIAGAKVCDECLGQLRRTVAAPGNDLKGTAIGADLRSDAADVFLFLPILRLLVGTYAELTPAHDQAQLWLNIVDNRLDLIESHFPQLSFAPVAAARHGIGLDFHSRDFSHCALKQRMARTAIERVVFVIEELILEARNLVRRRTDTEVENASQDLLLQYLWLLLEQTKSDCI